jgi:hypothetical protein
LVRTGFGDRAKAHIGILLNECADQLATRAVLGNSSGREFTVPPEDIASEAELVMGDDEVTRWEDWRDQSDRKQRKSQ